MHGSETEHKGRQEQSSEKARESPALPSQLTLVGKNMPRVVSRVEERRLSLASASFCFLRGGRAWTKMGFSGISCDPHDLQLFCSKKPALPIIHPPTLF